MDKFEYDYDSGFNCINCEKQNAISDVEVLIQACVGLKVELENLKNPKIKSCKDYPLFVKCNTCDTLEMVLDFDVIIDSDDIIRLKQVNKII